MPRKKKIKAVLYLYADQIKSLKKISANEDVPMSKLIRDAVTAFLSTYQNK